VITEKLLETPEVLAAQKRAAKTSGFAGRRHGTPAGVKARAV